MRPNRSTIDDMEPATREELGVAFLLALTYAVRRVGGHRLLFARVNWENLFASANPPGAPTPVVAKGSYTRQALRNHHNRRRELRGGLVDVLRRVA